MEKGTPFKPLEQLMGVFPPQSADFLPQAWAELMLAEDSPIADFYPLDFRTDLNGMRYDWQGSVWEGTSSTGREERGDNVDVV